MAPKAIKYGTYKNILNQATREVVLPDVYYNDLPQELRRMAFTVSNLSRATTIQSILDSLETAEKNGQSFDEWSAALQDTDFQSLAMAQKETVFRTNMTTQYNNGRLQVGINSETLEYLMYQATLDDATRPNHAANDGITLPINDPFWKTNTPPLGFNCRCIVLNLDAKDLEDNPLTPKDDIGDNTKPDDGFDFNVRDPEAAITKLYRDRVKLLPLAIRQVAIARLLDKNDDVSDWWKIAKKDFVKDE